MNAVLAAACSTRVIASKKPLTDGTPITVNAVTGPDSFVSGTCRFTRGECATCEAACAETKTPPCSMVDDYDLCVTSCNDNLLTSRASGSVCEQVYTERLACWAAADLEPWCEAVIAYERCLEDSPSGGTECVPAHRPCPELDACTLSSE